ncbi:MAG: glycine--tRNA ligase subunit beta [Pseudanabaenaceae cyanobacterium bins.68]|nr:glycine--tRNA ligase subunit beta [Pseudanabaenaceae cyanobacterium bins.68]
MATFLLEVGTEELPAGFVMDAVRQWRERVGQSLDLAFLDYQEIELFATPRRLAVLVRGLPVQQSDRLVEFKGPGVASAYVKGDPWGEPTKALLGFVKSRGADLTDLVIRATDKGEFVFVQQQVKGQAAAEVLPRLAQTWILGLEGKRLMRWGDGELRFPRPIRWLVALLDDQVLPVELENLHSDRFSQGHRVLHTGAVQLDHAETYVQKLAEAHVIVDMEKRRQKICDQIASLSELMGAKAEILPDLLTEVTQLVEFPTAIVGEFEREFLQLPPEVIETEMVSHQRYFPLYALGSQPPTLLPYFITISNGDPTKSKLIAAGNGRVIRARLADGQFFYASDRQQKLTDWNVLLEKVTFQEQLGSVAEKVERLAQIVDVVQGAIANWSGSEAEQQQIRCTALLCKADLVSQMVKEFPELQGVMGQYYAQASGEPPLVCQGIREHYLPRGAGDVLPESVTGKIVAISDRLDTLVGIFGLGIVPTGSSDPFALRRAAAGIVQIIWQANYELNLPEAIAQTTVIYGEKLKLSALEIQEHLHKWFEQRARTLLQERGIDYDLVDAVFGDSDYTLAALENLNLTRQRADFLQSARQDQSLAQVMEVVNRASRLAAQGQLTYDQTDLAAVVNLADLKLVPEQKLYQAIAQIPIQADFDRLWQHLQAIAPVLAEFFEQVMVMDQDPLVRQNRLNLLGVLRNHSRHLADFSAIR